MQLPFIAQKKQDGILSLNRKRFSKQALKSTFLPVWINYYLEFTNSHEFPINVLRKLSAIGKVINKRIYSTLFYLYFHYTEQ